MQSQAYYTSWTLLIKSLDRSDLVTNPNSPIYFIFYRERVSSRSLINKTMHKASAFLRTDGGELEIGEVVLRGLDGIKGEKV